MKRTQHWIATASALLVLTTACGSDDDSQPTSGENANGSAADRDYPQPPDDDRTFEDCGVNAEIPTAGRNQSTFALDVDTGSYAITRAALTDRFLPDPAAVCVRARATAEWALRCCQRI